MNKVFIGVCEYGEYAEAELNEDKTIRGFNLYDLIDKTRSYDGNYYKSMCGGGHKVTVKGKTFKTGELLPAKLPSISKQNKELFEQAYSTEGFYCYECGMFHDSEQYHDLSYVILNDCEVYCKECVNIDDMLVELNDASELFTAKDITGMSDSKHFIEVATLFCDSSVFGQAHEAALTQEQAIDKAQELIDSNRAQLYVGITGIGQFQVYVTVYKRKQSKKRRA